MEGLSASANHGDAEAVCYIVAIENAADALALIRSQASMPKEEVEDLGCVSSELLVALKLGSGQFVPARATKAASARASTQHLQSSDRHARHL